MTTFVLQPPIPATSLDFSVIFGYRSQCDVEALSQARVAVHADVMTLIRLNGDVADAARQLAESARTYRKQWFEFAQSNLLFVGPGQARSRRRCVFAWHEALLLRCETRTHSDASLLFESMCISLVLVAALQRVAAAESTSLDESLSALAEAICIVKSTRIAVLDLRLRPRLPLDAASLREPRLLNSVFVRALEYALRGQSQAIHCAYTDDEFANETRAAHFWRCWYYFDRARALVPGERLYRVCSLRAAARACGYSARFVGDAIQHRAIAPSSAYGIVVTFGRACVALLERINDNNDDIDSANDVELEAAKVCRDDYERANSAVYDHQRVIALENIRLSFRNVNADNIVCVEPIIELGADASVHIWLPISQNDNDDDNNSRVWTLDDI